MSDNNAGRIVNISCQGSSCPDGTFSIVLTVSNMGFPAEAEAVGKALHKEVPKIVEQAFAELPHIQASRLLPPASPSTETPQ